MNSIISEEVCSISIDKRIKFLIIVCLESSNSQAMDSGSGEIDNKPKKKPGRKMMMTEPVNVCFQIPCHTV